MDALGDAGDEDNITFTKLYQKVVLGNRDKINPHFYLSDDQTEMALLSTNMEIYELERQGRRDEDNKCVICYEP